MDNSWVGLIKTAALEAVEGKKPSDMATGTVLSVSPLSVQLDANMPPIPAEGLILTWSVKRRVVPVTGGDGTVVVNPGLSAGNKVLLLRVMGGQKYIILSTL